MLLIYCWRFQEAEAARASKAVADAAAATVGAPVVLAEAAGLWLNAAGEVAGRIELLAPVVTDSGAFGASGERGVATLRFVPADVQHDDGRSGSALASWGASASPLQQDGGAPLLLLDDGLRFSFDVASVVYFCVEEPDPEAELDSPRPAPGNQAAVGTPAPASPAGTGAVASMVAGLGGSSLAGMDAIEVAAGGSPAAVSGAPITGKYTDTSL